MRDRLIAAGAGLLLGFALSRIGFSSWDEVHRMFTFRDLRLLFTFAFAVVLLVPAWLLVARGGGARWAARPIHRGTLAGGVVFGAGWAVSGACPGIAFVQLGEGQLLAFWSLVGMALGNWLYSLAHERWFTWSPGVCVDA